MSKGYTLKKNLK